MQNDPKTLEARIVELERDIIRLQENTVKIPINSECIVSGASERISVTPNSIIQLHRLAIASEISGLFQIQELRVGYRIFLEENLIGDAYKSPGALIPYRESIKELYVSPGIDIRLTIRNISGCASRFSGWYAAIPIEHFYRMESK